MINLPKLPYKYNELEPVISEEQLTIHHTKHHQGYVNKSNDLLKENTNPKSIAFNLSGHKMHSLFWKNMQPASENNEPEGELLNLIKKDFKSLKDFNELFEQIAISVEGSGWAALGYDEESKKLTILQIGKHQVNLIPKVKLLLVLDVWEHAYYLDYQNKRADFVKVFWKIVNWDEVSKRL